MDEPTADLDRRFTRRALFALVAFAFVVRLFIIARTEVAARDSIGFVRDALLLERGPVTAVLRGMEHPPGYPLAVLVASWPVRAVIGTSESSMVLSAQLASAAFAALLVLPMYRVGRELFGRYAGLLAAALFQCLPDWIKLTSDGLSESTFLFWACTALAFGSRAVREPAWGRFLTCGAAGGLAYLTRPEGAVVLAAVGGVWAALQLLPSRRHSWRSAGLHVAALACGAMLVVGPYVATIGRLTNKNTGKLMIGDPTATQQDLPWMPAAPAVPVAVWWEETGREGRPGPWWALQAIGRELVQSMHYVGVILAVMGLFWLRPVLRNEPGSWVIAAMAGCHAAILWRMATVIGYVSERHTMLLVFAGCLPAAAALRMLAPPKFAPAVALMGLFLTGLPSLAKPLHGNRAGHRAAGLWIAANGPRDAGVLDPFGWANFYSGRVLGDNPPAPKELFVVVEGGDKAHSRLPLVPLAKAKAAEGVLVFQWPGSVPAEEAKVRVYRSPAGPPRGEGAR